MIINMTGGGKPELQAKTVTPSTSNVVVTPDSGYDGLSQVTVNGDPELVAGNIKEGVNIFGIEGTYGISSYRITSSQNYSSTNALLFRCRGTTTSNTSVLLDKFFLGMLYTITDGDKPILIQGCGFSTDTDYSTYNTTANLSTAEDLNGNIATYLKSQVTEGVHTATLNCIVIGGNSGYGSAGGFWSARYATVPVTITATVTPDSVTYNLPDMTVTQVTERTIYLMIVPVMITID